MKNIMMTILEDIDSLSDDSTIKRSFESLTEEELNYFVTKIKGLKQDRLYKSDIHGVYHSEKVCLFAYLIGLHLGLDKVDMEIITDAALYHDIGRNSDFEDSLHGLVSANMIDSVVDSPIYKNETNMKILQAIMDYHSLNDNRIKINFDNYEIEEQYYKRYELLAKILKDADALDRKRFTEKCNAALNPDLLRFQKARDLIGLAEEINKLYYRYLEGRNVSIDDLEYVESDCLHSIGFDYFRIASVLENGILSFKKMRYYGIKFPKNFDGGNGNKWISVVPTDMIDKNGKAFQNFIKSGITFFCANQNLYKPLPYNRKFEAIEKGLPYDKSGYIDEMYAFLEIPNKDIISMFIVKEYANKDVREMEYLYNSLDIKTLKNKIAYIFENIVYTDLENNKELCELISKYKMEIDKYMMASIDEKKELERVMPSILNSILKDINRIVGMLIHDYYASKLGKTKGEKVNVMDAVNYELLKTGLRMTILNGDEEIVYLIEHERKKIKTK